MDPPCLDSKSECTTPRCLALPMQQFQVSTFNFKWTRNNFGMRACRPFRSRPSHRGLKRGVPRSCAASLLLLAAWLGGCAAADVLTPRRRHRRRRLMRNGQSGAGAQVSAPARRTGSGIRTSGTRCVRWHNAPQHVRVHYRCTCSPRPQPAPHRCAAARTMTTVEAGPRMTVALCGVVQMRAGSARQTRPSPRPRPSAMKLQAPGCAP